jgi:hypothetical protein
MVAPHVAVRPFFTVPLLLLRFLFDLSEHSDEEVDGGATCNKRCHTNHKGCMLTIAHRYAHLRNNNSLMSTSRGILYNC